MKDFYGFDAIDYGTREEMETKYADDYFVFTENGLFGKGYVVFVSRNKEEAYAKEEELHTLIKSKSITGLVGINTLSGVRVPAERFDDSDSVRGVL